MHTGRPRPAAAQNRPYAAEDTTIAELAKREGIAPSFMTRVLRPLPAPDIVEAILDGRRHPEATMVSMLRPLPKKSDRQSSHLG